MPKSFSRHIDSGFLRTNISNWLILATMLMAAVYFLVLAFLLPKGNIILFAFLVAGEIFHLWQVFSYAHTIWNTHDTPRPRYLATPKIDLFITVAGEPTEIVEATVKAAKAQIYPNFEVYILNDGLVAKKDNWQEIGLLAQRLGVHCITRTRPGGAKAGNINHAITLTDGECIAVLDADQVPHENFLQKMSGYFADPNVGFVQSPQYYKNFQTNEVTHGAWEQQELFFGPICKGKNHWNAAFMCGTNMVIRRQAIEQVGGFTSDNIAEDFLTSLFIHQKGWKSVYVPEVLAEGLAPEDFYSYYKQQLRWARGSLEVLFKHNPLFKKGLTWHQKIEYLASASFYASGVIIMLNALLPLIFFYTGLVPLATSTMMLALIFLPYIFLVVLTLRLSSNYAYTFRALAFSMSCFGIHLQALTAVLLGQKTAFAVTSKKQLTGNFLYLAWPHLVYIALGVIGVEVALLREGLSAQVLTNLSWALFNTSVFLPFISAALPRRASATVEQPAVETVSVRK